MERNKLVFALVIAITFTVVGAIVSLIFSRFISFSEVKGIEIPVQKVLSKPVAGVVTFNPPLPQDAPADIKDAVMLGYNIMMDTRKYAAKYVGNKLNCANCQSEESMTLQRGCREGQRMESLSSPAPGLYRLQIIA